MREKSLFFKRNMDTATGAPGAWISLPVIGGQQLRADPGYVAGAGGSISVPTTGYYRVAATVEISGEAPASWMRNLVRMYNGPDGDPEAVMAAYAIPTLDAQRLLVSGDVRVVDAAAGIRLDAYAARNNPVTVFTKQLSIERIDGL